MGKHYFLRDILTKNWHKVEQVRNVFDEAEDREAEEDAEEAGHLGQEGCGGVRDVGLFDISQRVKLNLRWVFKDQLTFPD